VRGQLKLIKILREVAAGRYSDEIMELTTHRYPPVIQEIAEAVGMMMVKIEAREYRLEQLVEQLERLNEQIKRNILKTVTSIAGALEARDRYTRGHAERVAGYAERLARRLGLSEAEAASVRIGAVLHDIGKIGFSDALFSNEDTRPREEVLREIKKHPAGGVRILEGLDFLGPALDYVHAHHERVDGKGYPRGLSGEAIPLGARIVAVADCFDAMTTNRPYHKGSSALEAFARLRSAAGSQFDPDVVEAFIAEIEDNGMEE
jgi:putative nucleotidyltransferase with HDIG domain